jgi:hypothetical protein
VWYRSVEGETWQKAVGLWERIPKTRRGVHTVELTGLAPGQRYLFRLKEDGKTYLFQTLSTALPLRFVVGGDAYFYAARFDRMNEVIAGLNPAFVVVGGDLAYTNHSRGLFQGRRGEVRRWTDFLTRWQEQMVASDGRLIPLVPVIGNHDIQHSSPNNSPHSRLFYALFALPERGRPFRVMDVGSELSLLLLDTGHSYHIEGMQTEWLGRTLAQREAQRYKMAVYHIGGYPSVYPYEGGAAARIREHWSPLFEQYHVPLAFEHHNHAYKRTHPLKAGQIDAEGVVYMGDGSWGIRPRKPKERWYLAEKAQTNAVCLVTLTEKECLVEAVTARGEVIDAWTGGSPRADSTAQ